MDLSTISSVSTLLISVGIFFDSITYKKEKDFIHTLLIKCWYNLDEIRIPDFPVIIIKKVLNLYHKFFSCTDSWKTFSWKNYYVILCIYSFFLSSFSFIVGNHIISGVPLFRFSYTPFPIMPTYLINFIFDVITVSVTIKILKLIVRKKNLVFSVFVIVLDIIFSYLLIILCFSFLHFTESISINSNILGTQNINRFYENLFRKEEIDTIKQKGFTTKANIDVKIDTNLIFEIKQAQQHICNILTTGNSNFKRGYLLHVQEGKRSQIIYVKRFYAFSSAFLLMPCTIAIPTLIYMFFILSLVLVKSLLTIFRSISMIIIHRITEPKTINPIDLLPCTILAYLCFSFYLLIIIIIKLIN